MPPGILQRAAMTLNILEDEVLGILSKNPLRTQKSESFHNNDNSSFEKKLSEQLWRKKCIYISKQD